MAPMYGQGLRRKGGKWTGFAGLFRLMFWRQARNIASTLTEAASRWEPQTQSVTRRQMS